MTRNVRIALVLVVVSFVLLNAAAFTRGSHPGAALGFAVADLAVVPILGWFAWRAFRERKG